MGPAQSIQLIMSWELDFRNSTVEPVSDIPVMLTGLFVLAGAKQYILPGYAHAQARFRTCRIHMPDKRRWMPFQLTKIE